MSRRRQERAALRALQRRVWGDAVYESHLADLTRRRQRRFGLVAIVAGAQLVVIAFALLMFANPASAHTSQITISCTQVQFNYSNFPGSTATAHESIVIDGQQGPQRDFVFGSSSATDVITIGPLGPGTHMIDASTHWSFDGQPQGSAELPQQVSDCAPNTSTTTTYKATSTTLSPVTTTTTTVPRTSTTIAEATTVPTIPSSTTSITVGPQGSTTTMRSTTTSAAVVPPPAAELPFTGSSTRPLSFGIAMVGLGAIASGIASRKHAGRAD